MTVEQRRRHDKYALLFAQVWKFLSQSQKDAKGKKDNGRSQELATITYEVQNVVLKVHVLQKKIGCVLVDGSLCVCFMQTNEYLSGTPCVNQVRERERERERKAGMSSRIYTT